MNEAYLQYVWRYKRLPLKGLLLNSGEPFEIIDFGAFNTNSGADFFNGKIRIGDTILAGNIEIHVNSSDWDKHQHQKDEAYNNVVLHLVYKHDKEVFTAKGNALPTFVIEPYIDKNHFNNYQQLINASTWIPCQNHISDVDEFSKFTWLERLSIERLERKTRLIWQELEKENFNWEEVFYRYFLKAFGTKVNQEQFYSIAQQLPLSIIHKNADDNSKIEALLYGISGLLNTTFEDEYPKTLQKEFLHLKAKYVLQEFNQSYLKFSKLRPSNFPTIRLAQFSALLNKHTNWFSFCMESSLDNILDEMDVLVNPYWKSNYVFDKQSTIRVKALGRGFRETLVINVIVPFLFLYSQFSNDELLQEKAIKFLEKLPPENNSVIENWHQIGVKSTSAFQSQALLELKNEYCSQKKCVNCALGVKILNTQVK